MFSLITPWAVWAPLNVFSLLCCIGGGHAGVVWSALCRTLVGTTTSKMALHTCPGPLLGWLKGLRLVVSVFSKDFGFDMVAQDSKTEIGDCQASR